MQFTAERLYNRLLSLICKFLSICCYPKNSIPPVGIKDIFFLQIDRNLQFIYVLPGNFCIIIDLVLLYYVTMKFSILLIVDDDSRAIGTKSR